MTGQSVWEKPRRDGRRLDLAGKLGLGWAVLVASLVAVSIIAMIAFAVINW